MHRYFCISYFSSILVEFYLELFALLFKEVDHQVTAHAVCHCEEEHYPNHCISFVNIDKGEVLEDGGHFSFIPTSNIYVEWE